MYTHSKYFSMTILSPPLSPNSCDLYNKVSFTDIVFISSLNEYVMQDYEITTIDSEKKEPNQDH